MDFDLLALGWFRLRKCVSLTAEMASSGPKLQLSAFSNLEFLAFDFILDFHELFSQRMKLQIGFIAIEYLCVILNYEFLALNCETVLYLILVEHRLVDCGCLLCKH